VDTELVFTASAERDITRLDRQVAQRIGRALPRYMATGQGDVRRLTGAGELLGLRVGDWRVRFHVRVEERAAEPPATGTVRVRVI
jgi:hypothetical protein